MKYLVFITLISQNLNEIYDEYEVPHKHRNMHYLLSNLNEYVGLYDGTLCKHQIIKLNNENLIYHDSQLYSDFVIILEHNPRKSLNQQISKQLKENFFWKKMAYER